MAFFSHLRRLNPQQVGGGTPEIAMERKMEQGFHSGAYIPYYSLFIAFLRTNFQKMGNFNLFFEAPSVPHIQRYLPIVMVQNQRCCTKKYLAGGENFSRFSLANAIFTK